jgi:hypothetical protein
MPHYYDPLQEALCCLREAWEEGLQTPQRAAVEEAMLNLLKVPGLQAQPDIVHEIVVTGLNPELATQLLTALRLAAPAPVETPSA